MKRGPWRYKHFAPNGAKGVSSSAAVPPDVRGRSVTFRIAIQNPGLWPNLGA
jgi:hypothetical protein